MTDLFDARLYRAHSQPQLDLARDFLDRLPFRGDERVLDVGCGDGKVTELVAARVPDGSVTGLDRSASMVALARARHPQIAFVAGDCRAFTLGQFDAVVSFTALHWVIDGHGDALRTIAAALADDGWFAAQFPAAGNAANLIAAADDVMRSPRFADDFAGFRFPWWFADPDDYRTLAVASGLTVERCEAVARDVVHDGVDALAGWVLAAFRPHAERTGDAATAFARAVAHRYAEIAPPDGDGRLHVAGRRLEIQARRA